MTNFPETLVASPVNMGASLAIRRGMTLAVLSARNLVNNPSFEHDAVGILPAGYTASMSGITAGAGNLTVGTAWAASPGTKALHLNALVMAAGSPGSWDGLVSTNPQSVTAGQPYIASAVLWTPSGAMASNMFFLLRITWLNASGGQISFVDRFCQIGLSQGHPNIANGGRFTSDMDGPVPVAPAGSVTARVEFFVENWDFTAQNSLDLWVDQVSLMQGSTFTGYADGDTPGWRWAGTPGNSSSVKGIYATVGVAKAKLLTKSVGESAILKTAHTRTLPQVTINETATVTKQYVAQQTLNVSVLEGVTLAKRLMLNMIFPCAINESVLSLLKVAKHNFEATILEAAGLNKKGGYRGPPAVLQLYDLVNPYDLTNLRGDTVSYMHGIFGAGVAFDVYNAIVSSYVKGYGPPQVLGDWPSVYGQDGFSVGYMDYLGVQGQTLEDKITVVPVSPSSKFVWSYNNVERRIPQLPYGPNANSRIAGGWYGTPLLLDVVFIREYHGWMFLYWMDYDMLGRAATVTVGNDASFTVSAAQYSVGTYTAHFKDVKQGDSIRIKGVLTGSTNVTLSGVFLGGPRVAPLLPMDTSFYIADNGLKKALDQHPALARIF